MAGLAAEPGIEPLALAEIVGVGLVGLAEREIDFGRRAADAVRHQRDLVERIGSRRIEPQLPLFPLTSRKQQNADERTAMRIGTSIP